MASEKAKEKAISQINDSIVLRHIREDYQDTDSQQIWLLDDGYWNRARNFFKKNITERSHYEEKPNFVKRAVNYKYKFNSGNSLNILVAKNLTKDTTIAYQTTANNILELQKFGMTRSEALTSQLIETVGAYRLDVVKRAMNSGIKTTKTDLKLYIVDQFNDRIKQLQPIERLINLDRDQFDHSIFFDYMENLQKKIDSLNDLIDMKNTNANSLPEDIKRFLDYDPGYLEGLVKNISEELNDAQTLANELFNCNILDVIAKNVLKAEVSDDERNFLLTNFLRKRLDRIAMDAREQNQHITQGSLDSTFRGRLDQALSSAIILTTNYTFDQHNPITREHQSDYRTHDGNNKVIYNSREHIGISKSNLENLVKVIVTIENGGLKELLNNENREDNDKIKTVSSAGLRLPSFKKRKDLFNSQFRDIKTNIGSTNAFVRGLATVGKEIGGFVVLLLPTLWDKVKIQLLNLRDDYIKHSAWPTILTNLGIMKEKGQPKKDSPIIDESLSKFISSARKEAFTKNPALTNEAHESELLPFATPRSHLQAYKPNDILTDVVGAVMGIIDFVKDDIGDKHPVTLLAVCLAYVAGGAAMMEPILFKTLLIKLGFGKESDKIMTALHKIATYETSGTKFEEGTTLGFTEAKVAALTSNLAIEGAEGWLPKFVNTVIENPAGVIGAVATAYGVGVAVNYANIPGLSRLLHESEGRGKWIEEMVLGGKLAAVTSEMLLPTQGHNNKLVEYVGTALKFSLLVVRAVVSLPALSPQPWKELATMMKNGAASVAYNANAVVRKTAQIPKFTVKLFVDAGVMVISTLAKIQKPFKLLFSTPETNTKSSGLGGVYRAQKSAYNSADTVARKMSDNLSRAPMNKLGKLMTTKNTKKHQSSDADILTQLITDADRAPLKGVRAVSNPQTNLPSPTDSSLKKNMETGKKSPAILTGVGDKNLDTTTPVDTKESKPPIIEP